MNHDLFMLQTKGIILELDLTELEIKSIDERYSVFAVPVGNPTK